MRCLFLVLSIGCGSFAGAQPAITLDSLLAEMTDRVALASWPSPSYTCAQASSYDRASTSPSDDKTWFANGDVDKFIRVEERNGRKEHVMMDVAGPGAVVRIWSANPKGTLRIYLDGAETPVVEAPMPQALGGESLAAPPLSQSCSRGWNLYAPIPYSKRCLITSDEPGFYYQVNYRTYTAGTDVRSTTALELGAAKSKIDSAGERLKSGVVLTSSRPAPGGNTPAGESFVFELPRGPSAIAQLKFRLDAPNLTDALRTTILEMTFDGQRTVWCPLGDFFAQAGGINPFNDYFRRVDADGLLTCGWVMPYKESASIRLLNLGKNSIGVSVAVASQNWAWNERSMHFHAAWKQSRDIPTRPMQDWNYVSIRGCGVVVGDNLAVVNPVKDWWGEGDEKIYVDGETFPSHFGTGTEDYYGYAWCDPAPFMAPFHAQVRCDGPGNYGRTTVTRLRSLDAIPFTKSYQQDMEVWHWKECDVTYAAVTYFYAIPGTTMNVAPAPEEARLGSIVPRPLPPPMRIAGAIEAEDLKVLASSAGMPVSRQDTGGFGHDKWSNNAHLWGQGRKVGDFLEFEVPMGNLDGESSSRKIFVYATKSWDYGIVQFSVNGEPAGKPVDLFSGAQGRCEPTGPIDLGVHALQHPAPDSYRFVIRVEVVGGNEKAVGSRAFFAVDAVKVEKP